MRKSRFAQQQGTYAPQQAEAGAPALAVCRPMRIAMATLRNEDEMRKFRRGGGLQAVTTFDLKSLI